MQIWSLPLVPPQGMFSLAVQKENIGPVLNIKRSGDDMNYVVWTLQLFFKYMPTIPTFSKYLFCLARQSDA